ncbi:hypothetical protein P152DRAFT_477178 [Eremomyces bilateralis CBS 781.70]|uniref:Cytochrome c oxidase assembly factor 3 n=1 Tax=Eremomyces bilateralis CBS 781.70 TaxID=1392243 RepID=A0A6G1FSJ0_9PEZI|nr:uncharacterized protein P152DRAFT_477178 [Eremomyces bilateralis CBS 781.70]KAF1808642.1 hypothetical protein P152DRAFT_477178 [Eremomyces bilateralis CBS 781.70]
MPVIPRSSYYDRQYRQGPALLRARRPYLVKNTLAGLGIFGFCIGVYAFTISSISQDEFEDVVPTPPTKGAQSTTKAS